MKLWSIYFFECSYSAHIWESLVRGVMEDQFTVEWDRLIWIASGGVQWSSIRMFILRYALQATVWRERNQRRHGEASTPWVILMKRIDRTVRNNFTVIRKRGDKDFEKGMVTWFATRID